MTINFNLTEETTTPTQFTNFSRAGPDRSSPVSSPKQKQVSWPLLPSLRRGHYVKEWSRLVLFGCTFKVGRGRGRALRIRKITRSIAI